MNALTQVQLICRQRPAVRDSTFDGLVVVAVEGEVNPVTAPALESALLSAIASCSPYVVVDLTAVTFMDSSGLAALLAVDRRARAAGGGVRLVGASSLISRLLAMTGLDRLFPAHHSMGELVDCALCQPNPVPPHTSDA